MQSDGNETQNRSKGTEQEKEARRAERIRRDAEKFTANLAVSRPGFGEGFSSRDGAKIERQESVTAGEGRIDLSGILWLDPASLAENPYNEYPALSGEELEELVRDIAAKGVLVPLIVRLSEDVLICGHNRRRASIEAKEPKVPVQRVLRLLSEEEEREIMRSENDRRRGGNWSREKKEEFIREHFGERLDEDNRGGDRKSEKARDQNFNEVLKTDTKARDPAGTATDQNFSEVLKQQPVSLAAEIEKKSRGMIPKGTADRLLADMRKAKKRTEKPVEIREKERASLPEKDRKRGEKLALHLKTLRQTRETLEEKLNNVKAEEKRVLKELKTLGEPGLFGVE